MSSTRNENGKLWDYFAYATIPNDGKKHEIIRGEHYVSLVPSLYHEDAAPCDRRFAKGLVTSVLNGCDILTHSTDPHHASTSKQLGPSEIIILAA